MLRRILIPLDGSRVSERLLPDVVRLAKSSRAGLLLFHAVPPPEYFSPTAAEHVHLERERSASSLQLLAERLRREGCDAEGRVQMGEASREIVAEAERDHADLIAMSTHGRSGTREWAFGSVTERVLRTTRTPVLVFREGESWGPLVRRILIAAEGSEDSLEALLPVLDIAQAMGSAVTVVHAGRRPPPSVPMARRMLVSHHVPFDVKPLPGDPVKAILGAVRSEHADLLALTASGKTAGNLDPFARVADEIVKKCDRPVLVVQTGSTR